MHIIITGCAGFIGFHLTAALLKRGDHVIGIDNLNSYYDPQLKQARLDQLKNYDNFTFYPHNIADKEAIHGVFKQHNNVTHVIHLAAQAGVRYSLIDPYSYVQTNIFGHLILLEACKHLSTYAHFIYASSSSVYGANTKFPFSVTDPVDHPISLYAASKRSAELISQSYSHLFQIPQTGFRFFTVYGPWGRPDMAAFLFAKGILADQPISVFNNGKMRRNFTYIDDIIAGLVTCLDCPAPSSTTHNNNGPRACVIPAAPYHRLYNLGNNRSESLMDFISIIENLLGKKAQISLEPLQPGDVVETLADIDATYQDFGFIPQTNIQQGLEYFINWYKSYYKH